MGSNNPESFTPQAFQKSASSNPDKTKESSMSDLETGRHNVTDDLTLCVSITHKAEVFSSGVIRYSRNGRNAMQVRG
jgi:hypothetical protein